MRKPLNTHQLGMAVFVIFWALSSAAMAWKPEVGDKPATLAQPALVSGKPVNLADYSGKPW
ncbi:hypothetical protein SDC9_126480 [bioreactor metagenome]|uniref:Uncharacterized protein n=1 Tax=bioreactor metagenome TaxID=1076179 RepID=A0A645CQU2_9ZZZZ